MFTPPERVGEILPRVLQRIIRKTAHKQRRSAT